MAVRFWFIPAIWLRNMAIKTLLRRSVFAIGLLCLLAAGAFAADKPKFESPEGEAIVRKMATQVATNAIISIDAKSLMQAYTDNEAAANKKYKGKTLSVRTAVDLVSRDMFGTIIVYLKSGAFMPIAARLDPKVTVVEGLEGKADIVKVRQLPAEEAALLLKRGQPLQAVCKADGYNLGSPELAQCSMFSF